MPLRRNAGPHADRLAALSFGEAGGDDGAGLAPTAEVMVAARAAGGIGAAVIMPITLAPTVAMPKMLSPCPYCHGWEVRDEPIGILGSGPASIGHAFLFRQLTEECTTP